MPRSVRRFVQSLALCVACAGLVPVSAYGQSLKEQLLGTWTLVSWARFVGELEEPLSVGRDPVGQVMFAPDGHMCFNVMRRDRSQFRSPVFQAGTPEEKVAAYDTYLGFCGRYEVNEEERSVLLRLALSTYPNWTGSTQKRFAEVTGTRLQPRTPPLSTADGKKITNTVVWERAK